MILDTNGTRSLRRGSASLSTLVLALVAVGAAIGVVAGLMLLRVLLAHYDASSEFVYRRLESTFGWPVIVAPVGFTFVVLWLILFFRQPKTLWELLGVLHVPALLRQILLVWLPLALAAWFALSLVLAVSYATALFQGPLLNLNLGGALGSLPAWILLLILAVAPGVVYFLLICPLSLLAMCVDAPKNLIALGCYLAIAAVYVPLAYTFKDAFSWWVVLAPFLVVAFLYVALTYQRDAQSINTAWASFLGFCRGLVYTTLAFVFLLPGCQHNEITEKHWKVLVMLDVSGSMTARDDPAAAGVEGAQPATRQDKVIDLLTTAYAINGGKERTLLAHLLEKNPVVCYRFGGVADKEPVFFRPGGPLWTKEQFVTWLKPDKKDLPVAGPDDPQKDKKDAKRRELETLYEKLKAGTDIGGPTLEMVQQESVANNIQAILIFSDGQRNKGGDEAVKELLSRAANPKRPMQIITVGVGDYREPVGIRLNPLRAPSGVRPDDGPFTVRVPVFGDGLPDQKFEVSLFVQRTKDREGKDTPQEKKLLVGKKPGAFKGGDHPFDEVEFTVNLEELTGVKHKEDEKGRLQGTWEFTAVVPRHPREGAGKAEHVSDPPTPVLVLDKKLRVLLFASGPSRDYQFARNQFYREVLDKRMDLSIYLQAAGLEDVDQDVDGQRLLTRFPDVDPKDPVKSAAPENKFYCLKEYDVVIAFDADWMRVRPEAMGYLKDWVGERSGGLVFIGGPIYTDRLARPGGDDAMKILEPLFALLPVKLNDSVLQGLDHKGPDRTRPWPLIFSGNAKSLDFLKLDDLAPEALAGWNEYFWGTKEAQPGKMPKRGFFSYHPVESVKQGAEILATFGNPDAPRIMEGKYAMPYLVSMRFDKGKTFYVGSGELWRLKLFKEVYYERFLTKLVRYVSAGGSSKRTGKFSMAMEYVTGNITIEAEVLGKDEQPLAPEKKPSVQIVRPGGFDPKADKVTPDSVTLAAKKVEGRWRGIFTGTFPAETTGLYMVKLEIPGAEPFAHTFNVKAPNLEMGNLRTNFDHLQQLATEAGPVLERLDPATRDSVLQALEQPKGAAKEAKGTKLFFKLQKASVVPQLLSKVPPERNEVKGKFEDLWDTGTKTGWSMKLHWVLMITIGAIGLLTCLILVAIGRHILGPSILAGALVVVLVVFLVDVLARPSWVTMPLEMSTILGIIVGLLSVEWLTRKLLKLA